MAEAQPQGGLVLLGSTSEVKTDSVYAMKQQIAKAVGGQRDPQVLETAYNAIVSAIRRINMMHVFDFTKEISSDTSFVEGQNNYTVPASAFAIRSVQAIKATGENDGPVLTLNYEDPEAFYITTDVRTSNVKGVPTVWTVENLYSDQELLVHPYPSADAAASYDLRIFYHTKIDKPADSPSVSITAPEELSEAVITFGWGRVTQLYDAESNRHRDFYRDFYRVVGDFKASRQRSTPGPRIMRLATSGRFYGRRRR